MNMGKEAKTGEAGRNGELMLDELEAVSGGLKYVLTDTAVSSYSVSGHDGIPVEPIVIQ